MKVFVSSTVFDLIDVRSEVCELLRELGITPVMSDDKISGFEVQQGVNSIETCLINCAASDEVVIILDKRYGPRLGGYGFEDVSATHLEYRRAAQERRPIHVFVRDRLEADYATWKRNKRDPDIALSWVQSPKDHGLFELLDEHTKLVAKSPVTNWYSSFSTSVDLKSALRKYLGSKILPELVTAAIQQNQFPLCDIDVTTEPRFQNGIWCLYFRVEVTNVGGSPAFNFKLYYEASKKKPNRSEVSILAPGASTTLSFFFGLLNGVCPDQCLIAEYSSPIGVSVKDVFLVGGRMLPDEQTVIGGGRLSNRTFHRCSDLTIKIVD